MLAKELEAGHEIGQQVVAHALKSTDFEKLDIDDTLRDLDQRNERYVPKGSNGPSHVQSGVSVERAEAEFAELSKEFSHASQHNLHLSRKTSRKSDSNEKDVEKVGASFAESELEPFDLEQTLRGYREQDAQHGIKAKRIGVVWQNLSVNGIGGGQSIIRTFPDAFISFFNIPGTLMRLFGLGRKRKDDFKILRDFKGLATPGEMILVLGRYVYYV